MSEKSYIVRSAARFALMTIGLGVLGIIFGVAGALIGGKLLGDDSLSFGALGLAIGGSLIGYLVGILVGIVLIKKVFHRQGSLLFGILGAFIGVIITVLVAIPLTLNSNASAIVVIFCLGVPLVSMAGFHLNR